MLWPRDVRRRRSPFSAPASRCPNCLLTPRATVAGNLAGPRTFRSRFEGNPLFDQFSGGGFVDCVFRIRGTRITVELLLRALSEGATEADLLDAYPHLTHEDLQAAIAYAADVVGSEGQAPLKNRA
ncbi:MAG TPA: DUF433 domain-containing protein [Gammaproteobacteria bacterium]|nr:DUF433 domain-containing protein [Gammaproteobacteria bacterium]